MNQLHFGDNLDVLRAMPTESVDLIYLDPPFNSNADYNVLYGTKRGGPSQAQVRAFADTWKWGKESQRALEQTSERHLEAGDLLSSFQKVFGGSDMMAYLAMMTVRLIELHRVLKSSGSLFLHCDPVASHYLKILLDSIFGPLRFRNEIIWKRTFAHGNVTQRLGDVTDTILYFTKTKSFKWHQPFRTLSDEETKGKFPNSDQDGRKWQSVTLRNPSVRPNLHYPYQASNGVTYRPHPNGWSCNIERMKKYDHEGRLHYPSTPDGALRLKMYADESKGERLQSLWDDIPPIGAQAQERLGYPTQKPLALLERIIEIASDKDDTILDPFCGCGTAIDAAEKLGRRWVGIDITYLAIHVIEGRLTRSFGADVKQGYELHGQPKDANDARVLAARDWLEFQKWAVISLGGLPKDRPGADGGIDGVIRYHRVGIEQPNRAIVSVKGGLNVGVDAIHKLKSVIVREDAEIGVLVCLEKPTKAMEREASTAGEIGPKSRRVPRIQIVTVDMLFETGSIELPGVIDLPEIGRQPKALRTKKSPRRIEGQTEMLFAMETPQTKFDSGKKSKVNRSIRPVEIEVTRPNNSRKQK